MKQKSCAVRRVLVLVVITTAFVVFASTAALVASARAPHAESSAAGRAPVEWTQLYFDAAHTGYNPHEVLLAPDNVAELKREWTRSVGGVVRYPAVTLGARLFVTSSDRTLSALRRVDGTKAWSATLAKRLTSIAAARGFDPQPDPPGRLFVGTKAAPRTGAGSVYAFAERGRKLWAVPIRGGVVDSVVALKHFDPRPDPPGKLLVATDTGFFYALSTHNGATLCTRPIDSAAVAAPTAVEAGEPRVGQDRYGRVLVATEQGTLYLLSSHDCSVVWKFALGTAISGAAVADVDRDDHPNIFAGGSDGTMYALEALSSRAELRWSMPLGSPVLGTPVVGPADIGNPGIAVFAGTAGGDVYAIDQTNELPGPPLWVTHVGAGATVSALANGLVYVAVRDGSVKALATTDGSAPFTVKATRGTGFNMPIVVNGKVFVSTVTGVVRGYGVPETTRGEIR